MLLKFGMITRVTHYAACPNWWLPIGLWHRDTGDVVTLHTFFYFTELSTVC